MSRSAADPPVIGRTIKRKGIGAVTRLPMSRLRAPYTRAFVARLTSDKLWKYVNTKPFVTRSARSPATRRCSR